jgi:hypothetical protein
LHRPGHAATARAFNTEFGMPDMPTLIDPASRWLSGQRRLRPHPRPLDVSFSPMASSPWDSVGFVRIDLEHLSRRLDIPIFHDGDIVPAAKAG